MKTPALLAQMTGVFGESSWLETPKNFTESRAQQGLNRPCSMLIRILASLEWVLAPIYWRCLEAKSRLETAALNRETTP